MKKFFVLCLIITSFKTLKAQFTHPTGYTYAGIPIGSCLTTTCGGTYTDDGGAGNYSNNVNYAGSLPIYRTFCPNTAGNCIQLTFTSFDTEKTGSTCNDYLKIKNGPSDYSSLLTSAPANGSGQICGTPSVPFSYTSTDASGCLTVYFFSNGTTNRPGWSANISCVPCASGPSGTSNSDCAYATPLCSSTTYTGNSTGPGIVADGCGAGNCTVGAGGEQFSNWYQILINTSGTLTFTLNPSVAGTDLDWAIYGPNVTCASLGTPIRCNDAGVTGVTGMNTSAVATSASPSQTSNNFLAQMNVLAGQSYYISVDSWTAPGNYSINWGGTATFNCMILPIRLLSFDASYNKESKKTDLTWVTSMESSVSHYEVQKSTDAYNFKTIQTVESYSGNSNKPTTYFGTDEWPTENEINYYRILSVDEDGAASVSNIKAVSFEDSEAQFNVVPNPADRAVNLKFKSNKDEFWIAEIINGQGQVALSETYRAENSGNNSLRLDIDILANGIYFLRLTNGIKEYDHILVKE